MIVTSESTSSRETSFGSRRWHKLFLKIFKNARLRSGEKKNGPSFRRSLRPSKSASSKFVYYLAPGPAFDSSLYDTLDTVYLLQYGNCSCQLPFKYFIGRRLRTATQLVCFELLKKKAGSPKKESKSIIYPTNEVLPSGRVRNRSALWDHVVKRHIFDAHGDQFETE